MNSYIWLVQINTYLCRVIIKQIEIMPAKNHSELVKDKNNRILTAKGHKFIWRCIDIVAGANASNRYATEMKPVKEKLIPLITSLMCDKEMSIEQITDLIKKSKGFNIKKVNH